VPFSGVGEAGSVTPEGRRAAALLDLLARRGETPADRFLSALAWLPRLADLRLAFYALGAGRLKDVAQIDVEEVAPDGYYALPLRQGLAGGTREEEEAESGDGDGDEEEAIRPVHPRRRTIPAPALAQVVDRAWAVLERFERWPREAPLADHLDALARLLANGLGWPEGDERIAPLSAAAERLAAEAPAELAVSFEELGRLLARAAEPHGRSPLGGDGGGVAVLSVTEARARTFDHLFLLGLERDLFPRPVREDPLLPDALRLRLRALLPDLPVKGTGHDEERFLFAQLLSAAPRVTLSWRRQDESGRERPLSPLVERLRQARTFEVAEAPSVWSPRPARPADVLWRPAAEHATLAALHAPRGEARERVRRLLPRVAGEAAEELGEPGAVYGLDPGAVAAARARALDELEPDLATPEGRARDAALGPFFGFLGPIRGEDPRAGRLSVTMLERLADCPWQVVPRAAAGGRADARSADPPRARPAAGGQRGPRGAGGDRPPRLPQAAPGTGSGRGGRAARSLPPAGGRRAGAGAVAGRGRARRDHRRGGVAGAVAGGAVPPRAGAGAGAGLPALPRRRARGGLAGGALSQRARRRSARHPAGGRRRRRRAAGVVPGRPGGRGADAGRRAVDRLQDRQAAVGRQDRADPAQASGRAGAAGNPPPNGRLRTGRRTRGAGAVPVLEARGRPPDVHRRGGRRGGDRCLPRGGAAGARDVGRGELLPPPGRGRRAQAAGPVRLVRGPRGVSAGGLGRPPAPVRVDRPPARREWRRGRPRGRGAARRLAPAGGARGGA
jgi:hypothetical protein